MALGCNDVGLKRLDTNNVKGAEVSDREWSFHIHRHKLSAEQTELSRRLKLRLMQFELAESLQLVCTHNEQYATCCL